jgi:CheY-like chemotaxis protein
MLQPKVLDLGHVVAGMEKMLRSLLGEDIALSFRVQPQLGKVHADPSQIEQMVMNLAVNARDAMPRGGALSVAVDDLELREPYFGSHSTIAAGHYIRLTVSDTGVGMDGATREQIFEPFFTTKEPGKGTGLGLSTVFGIVKQSRAHIHVESALDHGTTFRIFVPCTKREFEKGPTAPPMPSTLYGNETILLVEDDRQLRELNAVVLREHGYVVLAAQDAQEALALSGSFANEVHLLLTDVVMPRMSGPALAEQIVPTRPRMRVLFISGYAERAVAHHGLLEAGAAFLQKPVTPDVLLRKVRSVLTAPE